MTLTVDLPDDLERSLRARAARDGRPIEEYVLGLIVRDAAGPELGPGLDASILRPDQLSAPTAEEFERLLDELASGPALPHLASDFSRADIYADHD